MKKCKLLLILAAVATAMFAFSCTALVTHNYSEWEITKTPTYTETGWAKRTCTDADCDYVDETAIPALSDQDIWKLTQIDGNDEQHVYKSSYGTVQVEHAYTKWTITTNPTASDVGSATRKCTGDNNLGCGHVQTITLPVLGDETFWNHVHTDASYTAAGSDVYTAKAFDGIVVTTEVERLVAPYENKTYVAVELDYGDAEDLLATNKHYAWTWTTARLSVNDKGEGVAFGQPFRGKNVITIIDAATGELNITMVDPPTYDPAVHEGVPVYKDGDNEYVFVGAGRNVKAYVDFVTGIFIMPNKYNGSFMDVYIATPFDNFNDANAFKSSAWEGCVAISYTRGEDVTNAFVIDGKVYFGVSFVDINGNAVAADDCSGNATLYVLGADGNVIGHYVHDGERLVVTDGLEGVYTGEGELASLTLNGNGVANETGKYTVIENNLLAVYVNGCYYEVTINENKTMTVDKPMVTVTFVSTEGTAPAAISVNKNIAVGELPVMTSAARKFNGWCYDEACLQKVTGDFIPTQDVTLYAYWVDAITIHIFDDVKGNEDLEVKIEADKTVGDLLAANRDTSVDYAKCKIFAGWFLDADFNEALSEEACLTVENDGIGIYAKWEDIPAAYGKFYGGDVGYSNSGSRTYSDALSIDKNGKAKETDSFVTIQNYDAETGFFDYYANATTKYVGSFDAKYGVMAYFRSSGYFFIYVRTDNAVTLTRSGYWSVKDAVLQCVTVQNGDNELNVLYYDKKVYAGVTFVLNDTTVTDVKTLNGGKVAGILKVLDDQGKVILTLGSKTDKTTLQPLDGYEGTYSDGNVVLNGMGDVTYGDKTGTYTLVDKDAKTFDVYLNDGKEYYSMVLGETTATLTKVMVTITFNVDGGVAIDNLITNKNIAIAIADAEKDGHVFRGWYSDAAFENSIDAKNYIPTADATIYAKFLEQVTVTVHANNDTEDYTKVYGKGETFDVANPTKENAKFEGWYTTATFDEGTEFNGGAVNANVEIYAKWGKPFVQAGAYTGFNLYGTKNNAVAGKDKKLTIDADGNFSGIVSGKLDAQYVEVVDGKIDITKYAYFNKQAGIVWTAYGSNATSVGTDTNILFSDRVTNIEKYSGSVVSGKYVAWFTITVDGNVMNVFCYKDRVYANVTWDEGITAGDANGKSNITVYAADGTPIAAKVNGSFVEADGYQGDYDGGTYGVVKVNGVRGVTFDGKTATYTVKADGTFDVYVMEGGKKVAYYTMTLNQNDMTATLVKPMASITLDYNGHGENVTAEYNVNISFALPAVEDVAGFKFRYWYLTEGNKITTYTPTSTDAVTLTAKWDAIYTFTAVFGKGLADYTIGIGSGDKVVASNLVYTGLIDGQYLKGWYTIGENEEHIAWDVNTPITAETTVYAEWADSYAQYGKYTGMEIWGAAEKKGAIERNKTLEIGATGKYSGEKSGQLDSKYSAVTDGVIELDRYTYFNQEVGMIVYGYSKIENSFGDDIYILFNADQVVSGRYSGINKTNEEKKYVAFFTLTMKDGSTKNAVIYKDKIYANVTWNEGITAEQANSAASLVVCSADGTPIFARVNGEYFESDGKAGTYTGSMGEIVLDGYTGGTINGTKITYTVDGNKIAFVYNGVLVCFTYDENLQYTLVTDGNEGTYALPDNGGNVTFDGFGNVTGAITGTYLVEGDQVAITVDGVVTRYGFDKANGALLGKSIFAGLTFTGEYHNTWDNEELPLRIVFNDGSSISGTIYSGYGTSYYFEFTATMEGNVITGTVTRSINGASDVGRVFTMTVSGSSIKFETSPTTGNAYGGIKGTTVTCADFVF